MREHSLNPKLSLDFRQTKGKYFYSRTVSKIDAQQKEIRQIERQKVLRVLAASTTPLTINQIKAETGIQLSGLRRRLAHLCYQRLIVLAFKDRCPVTGVVVSYFTMARPVTRERKAES